ncbi:molybdopterin-dependent oxidoreductase [Paraburkholderia sp. RL18-101-BIB-B]|uniref:molybdopterin cofactor-binding domain-containing protein n=1 Tax=Paraburkholderia sp. RL18-101-BIB-B TaxID=3031634 RepID=UPI0038B93CEE
MSQRSEVPVTRADFRRAEGVLLVMRQPVAPPPPPKGSTLLFRGPNLEEGPEILLAVWDDGSVTCLSSHVDLGTGIKTSLAQIVADELDVSFDSVTMVLGNTASVPDQGPTVASSTIQVTAVPLRHAAAQARAWLLAEAARRLDVSASELEVTDGIVSVGHASQQAISFGDLLREQHVELVLSADVKIKRPDEHKLVGTSIPRVDIPAKVTGETVFVHDMRVPGMLHGRVVRPPYSGVDSGEFVGNSLESVDQASIAHIPGVVAVVVLRDFVGVVAEREENAQLAMRELKVNWKPWPGMPDLSDMERAISANPSTKRVLLDKGDVDAALVQAGQRLKRTYLWPYQMHGSIGPSCAVADWRGTSLTVWSGTQNPHLLRADLSLLVGLAEVAIDVIRMEASGCYGRNCADDVAADAALLSRAVGRPVRVQLTREQEHLWEPKGAAQLMEVDGGLTADGEVAAYDYQTSYPSNMAPTLALLLTGVTKPESQAVPLGDRTAIPPYDYSNMRVAVNDMPAILRAAWLRGVSALPSSFAHESYIDELATAAGVDPVEFRLRYLNDERAVDLVKATAERAGWMPHTRPQQQASDGDFLRGRGFAYARYIHSTFPGFGAAWAAWVADVEVNRRTGEVHVRRVVVGHDAGMMINPAGVQHQIHGNVVQVTSRTLLERVEIEPKTNVVASKEWGSYPILSFRDVPVIEVMMMPRQTEPPLGAGESASVPGTAAIANAIFDATGVRFRKPPFTPETVLPELLPKDQRAAAPPKIRKSFPAMVGALLLGATGIVSSLVGMRSTIAPVTTNPSELFSPATIERGRLLAAVGNCVGCHTAKGGIPNAGGRSMDTPFGTIYSTNLTPDVQTGIGGWSLEAFQRAMREGVSRDGHLLYPAFPYTAFTKLTDDDLTSLYAYLMAQTPVKNQPPQTSLAFPYSVRPLLAAWNALYLKPGPEQADRSRSAQWNRGAYLVNGPGHCGACHTPRNALGAEKAGFAYLSGAVTGGWEAPGLIGKAAALPWSENHFYDYLRSGFSSAHGSASGPMASVVSELGVLPDPDVRAMAHYLASFNPSLTTEQAEAHTKTLVARTREEGQLLRGSAQRMFNSACGACHNDGPGPAGNALNLPLALNSNLHSSAPDNLIRIILDGINQPPSRQTGYMPAFRESLSDQQIAELAGYMRKRFAPDRSAWSDLTQAVTRVRQMPEH